MRHAFLDRYSRLDSPMHRLPAGAKLLGVFLFLIAAVTCPGRLIPRALAAGAAVLAAATATSRIPWRFVLRRLVFLEPFVVGIALLPLLQPGGWRMSLVLIARGTLGLWAMILLANTTPFADLLRALRRMRMPSLLITTLALMYRYLFVLIDEMERMSRARSCRTFTEGRGRRWRLAASVAGQLFIRTSERAERVYAAMCARGWRT